MIWGWGSVTGSNSNCLGWGSGAVRVEGRVESLETGGQKRGTWSILKVWDEREKKC